jgi:7SK snRNA methylphosphate capping enzyme
MDNPYLSNTPVTTNRRKRMDIESLQRKPNAILHSKRVSTVFGNYENYYSNRVRGSRVDKRIEYFRSEWFSGKRLLDVGCNAGHITLKCASLFKTSYAEGVDIDPKLISKARYSHALCRSLASETSTDYFPLAAPLELGMVSSHQQITDSSLQNIVFRCGDWIHEPLPDEKFDVVLALSITKWIQLNNGDGGIRHFFNKVYECLNDGGIFILEPQPFEGYRKRAGLLPKMLANYNEMQFFPNQYLKFLTQKVGFHLVEHHQIANESKRFERPLLILTKKLST